MDGLLVLQVLQVEGGSAVSQATIASCLLSVGKLGRLSCHENMGGRHYLALVDMSEEAMGQPCNAKGVPIHLEVC